jgi:hypothetical protein
MKGRTILSIAAAVIALAGVERAAMAIQACPDGNNCAQVTVDAGSAANPLKVGDTFEVHLVFKQGPDNAQAGGIDEIAALALTLSMGGGSSTPITLATCTLDGNGFPSVDVLPNAAISNFNVVVENANCSNGRTHCLCPDAGQTRDNFINLVIYGPNPLPTPGPGGIDIPTFPAGPQTLVTLDLKVAPGANGPIPLRIINQVEDTSRPQFTAFLSVGDKLAVDQTCVPVTGQPPCSATDGVSQVVIINAQVTVMGPPLCVGDCDNSGEVTVTDLITMVNIALCDDQPGCAQLSTCPVGDANGSGKIEITEIISGVNNALNGCPTPAAR